MIDLNKLKKELKETMLNEYDINIDYRKNTATIDKNDLRNIVYECIQMVRKSKAKVDFDLKLETNRIFISQPLLTAVSRYLIEIELANKGA